MTIVLTNDDGYQSEGLAAARDAIVKAGLRVVTVAPDRARSGGSRGATFRRPVRIDRAGGDDANPVYACDGTPVDCIRVALMSDLVPDVTVVISGVNEGANLGDDTTYSSTVGAAIEGALLGIGSIAVSQQSRDRRFRLVDHTDYDWRAAGDVVAALAAEAVANPLPSRTVLNVNIPGTEPTIRTRVTRRGERTYRRGGLEMAHTDLGHGFYSFHVNEEPDPPYDAAPGTDFEALHDGAVSLTPISLAWHSDQPLHAVRRWAESATATLDSSLGLLR